MSEQYRGWDIYYLSDAPDQAQWFASKKGEPALFESTKPCLCARIDTFIDERIAQACIAKHRTPVWFWVLMAGFTLFVIGALGLGLYDWGHASCAA